MMNPWILGLGAVVAAGFLVWLLRRWQSREEVVPMSNMEMIKQYRQKHLSKSESPSPKIQIPVQPQRTVSDFVIKENQSPKDSVSYNVEVLPVVSQAAEDMSISQQKSEEAARALLAQWEEKFNASQGLLAKASEQKDALEQRLDVLQSDHQRLQEELEKYKQTVIQNEELTVKCQELVQLAEESRAASLQLTEKNQNLQQIVNEFEDIKEKIEQQYALIKELERQKEALTRLNEKYQNEELEFDRLKTQKDLLLKDLQSAQKSMEELTLALDSQKRHYELQLKDLKEQTHLQKKDAVEQYLQQKDDLQQQILAVLAQNEDFKLTMAELKKEQSALQETLSQLQKTNESLREKEQWLHYELSKSRAQAVGWQKICEGLKSNLEKIPH